MRPKVRTQFFEGIESINQFALDLLEGKIILCESLQDCRIALDHINTGVYDHSSFDEITLFIMPELQLLLLAFNDTTNQAVMDVQAMINEKVS